MDQQTVIVICVNHFDPIWRRCWQRRFEYQNQQYASYAEIQTAVIEDFLALAETSDYSYVIEQGITLHEVLQRNPQWRDRLRQLAQQGRFEVLGAGWTTMDANQPLGETLARNFIHAVLFAEEVTGEPVTTGSLWDVFGVSAQLPQIFRQCEIDWALFICYQTPDGNYWRGLDGSVISIEHVAPEKHQVSFYKYPPCEVCAGQGCKECRGRGFQQSPVMGAMPVFARGFQGPVGVVRMWGEEILPSPTLPQEIEQANRDFPHQCYRFGTYKDVYRYHAERIQSAQQWQGTNQRVDGNPTQTGCYVSRSAIKRGMRVCEAMLLSTESLAAAVWWHNRRKRYPAEVLRQAWRDVFLVGFHDAVTGTHVDPAYEELLDLIKQIQQQASQALCSVTKSKQHNPKQPVIYNPHSWSVSEVVRVPWSGTDSVKVCQANGTPVPVYDTEAGEVTFLAADLPPLGCAQFTITPVRNKSRSINPNGTIENRRYRVTATEHGIVAIYDKHLDRDLFDPVLAMANELMLERDAGDPWTVREKYRPRKRLGPLTRLKTQHQWSDFSELVFEGAHSDGYQTLQLQWTQSVRLYEGLDRIDFITDVDWHTYSQRLRVAFPTRCYMTDDAWFGVPYGALLRKRYEKETQDQFTEPDGDWPANEWVAVVGDHTAPGVAVLNAGTPSCRVEDGIIYMSLLRSPEFPCVLDEPQHYRAPVYDGMRDPGHHQFRYALMSFDGDWKQARIPLAARGFNLPPVCLPGTVDSFDSLVRIEANTARIETIKQAEQEQALVIRVHEWAGEPCTAVLHLPKRVRSVVQCNLLERQSRPLKIQDQQVCVSLRPFEIATLKVTR